jgi:predicted Rossmann fold nucleotide-binding protein DprA/Smf involved in DNA uptake
MNYENKLLLSLVNKISEIDKINFLKANLNTREINYLHKKYSTKDLDKKYSLFKHYKCAFVDDFYYPVNLSKVEIPPFRIASTNYFPSTFDYYIGVFGSDHPNFYSMDDYYNFGYDLAKNNVGLVTLNFSGVSKIVQEGYSACKKEHYCLLAGGFTALKYIYIKNPNTVFLSPFEVDGTPTQNSFLQSYEIYGALIDSLILFQCGRGDDCKRGIARVLDCGTNVYVHQSAISNNKCNEVSYNIYEEGCQVINCLKDLLLYQ